MEDALRSAPSLAGADITVRTREGYVTLSGFAVTMEDIAHAGRLALRVRGVTGVNNKIPSRGAPFARLTPTAGGLGNRGSEPAASRRAGLPVDR